MKKIIFVLLVSFQSISIYSMTPEGPLANLPPEILYEQFQQKMLAEIAKAKTLNELKKAYNSLARFAPINKQYANVVNDVKKSTPILDARDNKREQILKNLQQELIKKDPVAYSDFNFYKNGINAPNKHGDTALIVATNNNNPGIASLLIANGININAQNLEGSTALMTAIRKHYNNIVELLLNHNANPNIQDKYGYTALMEAVLIPDKETVELLLTKGAGLNIKNRARQTALDVAKVFRRTEIINLLENYKK